MALGLLGLSAAMLYVLAVSRGDGPFADGAPAPAAVVAEGARFSAAPVAGAQPVRLVKPRDVMAVGSAAKLSDLFSGMGYHLDRVRQRDAAVPRVFLANLPPDLKTLNSIATRKTVFLRTMLPLVLSVNESILLERGRLLALRQRLVAGRRLGRVDRDWVEDLSRRYGLDGPDIGRLLKLVDIVPPSLALAQAVEESGWGTSRFALEGNAPFGQWTFNAANGLVPRQRGEGKVHLVRTYDHLLDGVRSYMLNLNTHRAYREFRAQRAKLRRQGRRLDGYELAGTLTHYSERGAAYVATIRKIMEANDLRALDQARLRGTRIASLGVPAR